MLKRPFDLAVSALLIILFLPIIALISTSPDGEKDL
jgi:lipopolysaccharide/colanic/teichoic acid biosynthesis glycosyltransferase